MATYIMILPREFYMQDPLNAAHELLGAYLCRRQSDGTVLRAKICEVELYHQSERGCHAFGGRQTTRNDAMFMSGGHAYVYLCYGMHNMLNIVLGKEGCGVAVLIRALEMDGCNGPGKLTRVFGITRADNKMDLTGASDMWLEPRASAPKIKAATRIGIDYAGADATLPWRFIIDGSSYISRKA